MLEQAIPRRQEEFGAGPRGLGAVFGAGPGVGMVMCGNGLHDELLPVANMTVGQIRARLADRLDIDPRAQAQLDGADTSDDVVVRAGQRVTFVHTAGEKGRVGQVFNLPQDGRRVGQVFNLPQDGRRVGQVFNLPQDGPGGPSYAPAQTSEVFETSEVWEKSGSCPSAIA